MLRFWSLCSKERVCFISYSTGGWICCTAMRSKINKFPGKEEQTPPPVQCAWMGADSSGRDAFYNQHCLCCTWYKGQPLRIVVSLKGRLCCDQVLPNVSALWEKGIGSLWGAWAGPSFTWDGEMYDHVAKLSEFEMVLLQGTQQWDT